MKERRQDILLKIFSGPHIGAELALMPGEYTIGHSDECDIVLQDSTIERQHAVLKVTEKYIDILPLENKPLLVAGRPSDASGKTRLDYYSVITIGTTHLAVGNENGDWSKILLPKLSADNFAGKEKETSTIPETPFQKAVVKSTKFIGKLRLFMETFVLRSIHVAKKIQNTISKVIFSKKGLTMLSVGTIAGISILTSGVLKPKTLNTYDAQKHALQTILGISTTMGFTGLNAEPLGDEGIFVSGYIDDDEQLEALFNETEKLKNVNVEIDVYVGSKIRTRTSNLLNQLGINNIDVRYRPHGVLELSGYHASEDHWTKTKGMIMNDIPGVLSVDTKEVKNLLNRERNLRDSLSNTTLAKKVAIESNGNNILISGILANEEIQKLHIIIDNFRRDYGKLPHIKVDLIDSQRALDIDIKSVRVGEVPYIVTATGARYLTGAFLPNGFTIKSITPNQIVMQKNRIEVTYPLN